MADKYDAMAIGFPEYIHDGDEVADLIGADRRHNGLYQFINGDIGTYSLNSIEQLRTERVERIRNDAIEESLNLFCTATVVGFIYNLLQDEYIDDVEAEMLLDAIPDSNGINGEMAWDDWVNGEAEECGWYVDAGNPLANMAGL